VPRNDIAAVRKLTEGNTNITAVFFEAIQGEGGIHPMTVEFMQQLRAICDERDWLLMIDEVQCGMGRTGHWFGFQAAGIRPDAFSLAKGLGGGVPIGALVAGPTLCDVFQPGHAAQQRALAAARRADEHGELAMLHIQVDAMQHGGAPVVGLAHLAQ
jgi:acetylornithine aminotransferase